MELFIIPGIAVFFPWWITIRLYRCLAYLPFLYRLRTQGCAEGARYLGLLWEDEKAWIRMNKINVMVDFADAFLLLTRSNRYWHKYIDENITRQLQKQQIIFFPHYGAGAWLYRILLNNNNDIYAMGDALPKNFSVESLYLRFRVWVLRRYRATYIRSNDMRGIRAALKQQGTILVCPDMPEIQGAESFKITTALGRLNVLSRFFKLAENRQLPVMCAVFALDPITGRRHFDAVSLTEKTAEECASVFADKTVAAIQQQSYLWRMMVNAPQVILPEISDND